MIAKIKNIFKQGIDLPSDLSVFLVKFLRQFYVDTNN